MIMNVLWRWIPRCVGAVAATLVLGCGSDGSDDDGGDDAADSAGSASAAAGEEGSGGEGGGASCSDACATLAEDPACADFLDAAGCEAQCGDQTCAACLEASASCGADCEGACAGGGGEDGSGDGGGSGDDGGSVPMTECTADADCGISFECVACRVTDDEGWCEQTTECSFDSDCGTNGRCGYNVETSSYRCLPSMYCG